MRGGKVIIGSAANSSGFPFDFQILDSKWEFGVEFNPQVNIVPTSFGSTSGIFTGPFGNVSSANQGGTIQGYFNQFPENSIILGEDELFGEPTLVLDCKTLDLIIADGDAVTSLGGVSFGGDIVNDNDRFWTNIIAYMDNLQSQPVITMDGTMLSTGSYTNYQWFNNGIPISGATSNTYNTNGEAGNYAVEVSLECGCNNVSSLPFVIVGIDDLSNTTNLNVFPNPVTKYSLLEFSLLETDCIEISLFDIRGKKISRVFEGELIPGNHRFNIIDDENLMLDKGVYSLIISGEKTSAYQRFMVK